RPCTPCSRMYANTKVRKTSRKNGRSTYRIAKISPQTKILVPREKIRSQGGGSGPGSFVSLDAIARSVGRGAADASRQATIRRRSGPEDTDPSRSTASGHGERSEPCPSVRRETAMQRQASDGHRRRPGFAGRSL